ncbi:MAG: ATP-dependent protease LonB [Candidatus Micrarchaeota archaeon]
MRKFKTTAEINVSDRLIDQIIGQDRAVDIIKKAARQKRNVLLIGPPGTGKSMLAQAMAELMPPQELEDVLILPNPNNENQPRVNVVKTYPDEEYLAKHPASRGLYSRKEQAGIKKFSDGKQRAKLPQMLGMGLGRRMTRVRKKDEEESGISPIFLLVVLAAAILALIFIVEIEEGLKTLLIIGALGIGFLYLIANATSGLGKRMSPKEQTTPKLVVDNSGKTTAPFIDATGTRAGALLGDVKHDPLQSGGLGTPAHLRVESGAVHRANKGVLFIDEIASLKLNWQQELLTAMQEKRYPITGQSDMSSGALVKTERVPTDFVLVAAGNLPDMKQVHPALRSRIRGGGYEIYVEDSMEDTPENADRIISFVAQEVKKDGRIPNFDSTAVAEILEEARKMSGRRKRIALNLRELGGLVRAAGDIARERDIDVVTKKEVMEAKKIFKSIESQLGAKIIERKREYQTIITTGAEVGRVNGLAVLGDSQAGLVLPIVAEATPAASKSEGKVIATGKLGQIAKEAVENVSAIIKKYIGTDISKMDLHIQFLQTYEGLEGDSASISTALAVISAVAGIPVHQNLAMTGSLDVRGRVMPIGGVTAKIEAAVDSGISKVLIPKANAQDVYLGKNTEGKVKVIEVTSITEVLDYALKDCKDKRALLAKMRRQSKGG